MGYLVLGVGYSQTEYAVEKEKWDEYGIAFDFVDDMTQAAQRLAHRLLFSAEMIKHYIVKLNTPTMPADD